MKVEITTTAMMLVALFMQATNCAQAAMLQGGVQQSVPVSSSPAVLRAGTNSDCQRISRANILEGNWACTSQVISSAVRGVLPGTQVNSMIHYQQDGLGNMVANWFQNSWSPATSAVVKIDTALMTASRESAADSATGWSARCQDVYRIVAPNKMVSESIVQQFANGVYIGSYKTQSVLIKAPS